MIYTAIWAHRGASAYAPENTMPAFLLAARLGADGIELDVHITSDGEVVVCHDGTTERTGNAPGSINDMTLEELRALEFGCAASFGGRFPGVKISTLAEVYEAMKPYGLNINVELKGSAAANPGIVHAVTEKSGIKERVIYSSFAHDSLAKLVKLDSTVVAAPLYTEMEAACDTALEYGAKALHPWYGELFKDGYVSEAHEKELRLHAWTCNNPTDMQRLLEAGADAIITDMPDIAVELRDKYLKTFN